MADVPMYHNGSRELQDRFATRALADRVADVLARDSLPRPIAISSRAGRCFFFPRRTPAAGRNAHTKGASPDS